MSDSQHPDGVTCSRPSLCTYSSAMSAEPQADRVRTEQVDRVMVIHLDDGKANALSPAMMAAINAALDAAEADDTIGAVVLHGRPGVFCAGFDLSVMRAGDLAAVVAMVADGGSLVHRLYGSPLPIVAACTGHALAAGALVLLGCDVRVGQQPDGEATHRIGLNEVAIGMVLPAWAMTIAVERLSRRHLQRAVANARITDAPSAVEAGYLDELAPAGEVLATAIARAQELAASLHRRAYIGTVAALRGDVLARMGAEIAADRAAGTVPSV
jgi:enoyl-CoA hydratase